MKKATYNLLCIIVSTLFLLVMAFLFGGSLFIGVRSAAEALLSGYGIFAAIATTFPYLLFCIFPGVYFYGCFAAFREFLRDL